MTEDELRDSVGNLCSYLEILCKAVLLDKVKIVDGRIEVEKLYD